MAEKAAQDKFEYSKDNQPIVIKSQEQLDKLRAAAKKEREEQMKRIAAKEKGENGS